LERREIKSYVWSGVIKKAMLGVGLDIKLCFEQCKRKAMRGAAFDKKLCWSCVRWKAMLGPAL